MYSERASALSAAVAFGAFSLPTHLREGGGGVRLAEEDRLELVHPGVREEEGGILQGDDGRGRVHGVLLLLDEVVDECLADLVGRPL